MSDNDKRNSLFSPPLGSSPVKAPAGGLPTKPSAANKPARSPARRMS